jgi:hypothetical protein
MPIRSRPRPITTVLVAAVVLAGCTGGTTAPSSSADATKPAGQGLSGQGTVLGSVVVGSVSGTDTVFAPVAGATVKAYLYVYGPGSGGSGPGSGDSTPPTPGTVTLQLVTTLTADQTGHFTIIGLVAGTYEIDAAGPAGSSSSGSAIIQSSGDNTVTVHVEVQTESAQPPPPPPPHGDSTTAHLVGRRP